MGGAIGDCEVSGDDDAIGDCEVSGHDDAIGTSGAIWVEGCTFTLTRPGAVCSSRCTFAIIRSFTCIHRHQDEDSGHLSHDHDGGGGDDDGSAPAKDDGNDILAPARRCAPHSPSAFGR